MSTEQVFAVENMVILTSKIEIDSNQWVHYMKNHYWDSLIKKDNTRFLVLSGTHGKANGKIGDKDYDMILDYKCAIEGLKRDFKEDIIKHNIKIFLEDVSNHIDSYKIDEEKLVAAVKEFKPSIINLAFCFTEVSEINDILRAAGIYSVLIMSQDRAELTEGKYVILDNKQREIIDQVTEKKPQNVILYGSSGTGKTILLTQALGIKASHFRRQNIAARIIVSSFGNNAVKPKQLMRALKTKYLEHLKLEKKDFVLFKDLCEGRYVYIIDF